jgi:hypothetical protein
MKKRKNFEKYEKRANKHSEINSLFPDPEVEKYYKTKASKKLWKIKHNHEWKNQHKLVEKSEFK